jgi:hypothetical protein
MANRLTKGRGLLGAIRTSGVVAANTATKKATVTTLTDAARRFDSRYGCHEWWFVGSVLLQHHGLRLFQQELLLVPL